MVNAQPRLAHLVEHKPIRAFVIDDFRNPSNEAEIIGIMPDYADFCEKRRACRASLKSVVPELQAFYQEPLLTKLQEQHLFRQFNYFKFNFVKTLDPNASFNDKGIIDYSDTVLESDIPALERYQRLATQVKHQLVSSNTRLVMNIAKKQKEYWSGNGGIDLLVEIVAEGNVGLLRAVDYFDFRKNFKFSTYATWAVLDAIVKARKARHKQERIQTGVDEFIFEQIMDDREPLLKEQNERMAFVSQIITKISERQQMVLKECFERGRPLRDIGNDLQISKERVRQLRDKAIERIRKKLG